MGVEANLFEDSYLFSYSYKLSEEDVLHKIVLPVLLLLQQGRPRRGVIYWQYIVFNKELLLSHSRTVSCVLYRCNYIFICNLITFFPTDDYHRLVTLEERYSV